MEDVTNTLIRIINKSTADAIFEESKLTSSETMDKVIKIVKSTLEKAHAGITARKKAKPLHDLLLKYNRNDAVIHLDKNIREHENFINILSLFTGKYVVYGENLYANKTDDDIVADVRFIIIIIYLSAFKDELTGAAFTKVMREIVKLLINKNIQKVRIMYVNKY